MVQIDVYNVQFLWLLLTLISVCAVWLVNMFGECRMKDVLEVCVLLNSFMCLCLLNFRAVF